MIFDTHSHCYWDTLEPCIDEVIARMHQNGVKNAVQIGCDTLTSKKAIALATQFPDTFFATVGVHPETAQGMSFFSLDENRDTIQHPEYLGLCELLETERKYIVAIGETGFDYHYLSVDEGEKEVQKKNQEIWFLEQWRLAQKYDLPLVIHTRDARDMTLQFLKQHDINRCVMHCFSEDWDFARELLDFSREIYFSFSGIVTYKSATKIQEAASKIPLDRILVETDAPFLAPVPLRGQINEPAYTSYTLAHLCTLRTESPEYIESILYENSLRFYGIQ